METITIEKHLAFKCAEALVDQHNAIAEQGHDACTLISFRSLYRSLCSLGCEFLIASAIQPVNKWNFPLFDD